MRMFARILGVHTRARVCCVLCVYARVCVPCHAMSAFHPQVRGAILASYYDSSARAHPGGEALDWWFGSDVLANHCLRDLPSRWILLSGNDTGSKSDASHA